MIGTSWCGTVFYRVRYGAVRYIHLAIPDRKFIVSNQNIFRENEAGQAKMRAVFSDYFVFSVLLLFFFLFGVKLCTLASFLALIIVCNYKHRQDYIQNETKDSKTHDTDFVYRGDFADDLKTSDVTDSFNLKSASTVRCLNDNHCSDWSISTADRVTNSFFNIPSIMWKNQSIPFSKESPSKPKTRMNTTMPLVTTSPMSARQRKNNLNGSMTAATGSLLSTPFLPQIKRALGLEPRSQVKYGYELANFGIHIYIYCLNPVKRTFGQVTKG